MSENSTDFKRNDRLLAVYTLALKNINFAVIMSHCSSFWMNVYQRPNTTTTLACIASGSVWIRSKEQETRVQDGIKNGASKRAGREWERKVRKYL